MTPLKNVPDFPDDLFFYFDKNGTLMNNEEDTVYKKFNPLERTLFSTRTHLVTVPGPVTYEKILEKAYQGSNGPVIEVRYRIKP